MLASPAAAACGARAAAPRRRAARAQAAPAAEPLLLRVARGEGALLRVCACGAPTQA
jgi:hypothetical protein